MDKSLAAEICLVAINDRAGNVIAPDWLAKAEGSQPLGRLVKPAEVAQVVAFLLSERAGMMTGSYGREPYSHSDLILRRRPICWAQKTGRQLALVVLCREAASPRPAARSQRRNGSDASNRSWAVVPWRRP